MNKNEKNKVILGLATQEPRNSAESKKETTLSSRGRAESSDVVISCDKVLVNIRKHYCMSHLFSEIATSAFRLLAMTLPTLALAAVLAIANISESRAEENLCMTIHGTYSTCIEKLADENGNNSCGDNCTFKVIEQDGKQVLHVYKNDISKPATIRQGAFSPYYYEGRQVLDAAGNAIPLNNVILDNDFEYSPFDAFAGSNAQISSASGKFVFNSGQRYFASSPFLSSKKATLNGDVIFNNSVQQSVENTKINGDVIISDNVTGIKEWSFEHSEIFGNLIIPDTIQKIGQNAFRNLDINGKIYCASGINNCYEIIKNGCSENESCLSALDNLYESEKFSDYPDGCVSMGAGAKCTKCKNASYKLEDDWCLRKRYTPAEAAEVLHDGSDNEIIMTFKVNR